MGTNSIMPRNSPKHNENNHSQIFRFFPDALLLVRNGDKVVLDINTICERVTGYGREEILGQTVLKMVFFLDTDLWTEVFDQLEAQKAIRDIKTRILSKESTIVNVNISIEPIELDGQPSCLIVLRRIDEKESTKIATIRPPFPIDTGIEKPVVAGSGYQQGGDWVSHRLTGLGYGDNSEMRLQ